MFDRGVLFVGGEGVGLGLIAEALALEYMRESDGAPLRVYSATTKDGGETDPFLVRALHRMELDTKGLSLKPLALFAFAGAPRIDHAVLLGTSLPSTTRMALSDTIDVRRWEIDTPALKNAPPGTRYATYTRLAETMRSKVEALLDELNGLDAVQREPVANSA